MDHQHLRCERDGEVVTITLDRPDRRNCLSSEVLAELDHALRATGEQDDVAGIILAASGPVFSAGHDLSEMASATEDELRALFATCTSAMTALAEVPQVVVASCDLVVAAGTAGFATPGGKGGLFCHTPMVAVARQIGRKRATELAFTGGEIDAATALAWGLVNRVVPADELEAATRDFVAYATRGSRYAKGLGKATLYAQMDLTYDDAYELAVDVMARAAAKGDGAEWPRAFVEKRPPDWTHTE